MSRLININLETIDDMCVIESKKLISLSYKEFENLIRFINGKRSFRLNYFSKKDIYHWFENGDFPIYEYELETFNEWLICKELKKELEK